MCVIVNEMNLNILCAGDACVGKSALTQVFQSGGTTYPKNYLMTIGAEFGVKQIPLLDKNILVEFFIYDCAGQSIFNQLDMNSKYYENASAVLIVYSIANRETLQSTSKWMTGVKSTKQSGPSLIGALVGNKCEFREDMVDSRAEVSYQEGESMASHIGLAYFETSAANNFNVNKPFEYIAEQFARRYEETLHNTDEYSRNTMEL